MNFSKQVTQLSAKDFTDGSIFKLKDHRPTAVLFYAPWCPACQSMHGEWNKLAESCGFMRIAAFNCDSENPQNKRFISLAREKSGVPKYYPTMMVYNQGNHVGYIGEGNRAASSLMSELMQYV